MEMKKNMKKVWGSRNYSSEIFSFGLFTVKFIALLTFSLLVLLFLFLCFFLMHLNCLFARISNDFKLIA